MRPTPWLCSAPMIRRGLRLDGQRSCRRNRLVGTAVVLAIAVLFAELAADLQLASAAVTGSPIYWGTWLPGAPYTQAALDAFEAGTGKGQSIVHWGQAWVSGGKSQVFQIGTGWSAPPWCWLLQCSSPSWPPICSWRPRQ